VPWIRFEKLPFGTHDLKSSLPPAGRNGPARVQRISAQISGMMPKPMNTGLYE
jgi:hypothetical protein